MFGVYRETNVQYSRAVCFYQFCFKLGELIQTHEMLQKAFDNESTGQTQTYERCKRIKTEEI